MEWNERYVTVQCTCCWVGRRHVGYVSVCLLPQNRPLVNTYAGRLPPLAPPSVCLLYLRGKHAQENTIKIRLYTCMYECDCDLPLLKRSTVLLLNDVIHLR